MWVLRESDNADNAYGILVDKIFYTYLKRNINIIFFISTSSLTWHFVLVVLHSTLSIKYTNFAGRFTITIVLWLWPWLVSLGILKNNQIVPKSRLLLLNNVLTISLVLYINEGRPWVKQLACKYIEMRPFFFFFLISNKFYWYKKGTP